MIAGVAGITLLVAACGSSSPSSSAKSKVSAAAHSSKSPAKASGSSHASAPSAPSATSGTATLKAQHTILGTVLATSAGYTLYGFTKDSSTASACTGTCAATWHPLTGTPQAAPGVSLPGTLGTITRSGGVRQATFNGHPLYTFKDDTTPGEVKGENELEFGGRWLTIPVVAAVGPSTPASPSKSAAPPIPTSTSTSHTRSGGAGP